MHIILTCAKLTVDPQLAQKQTGFQLKTTVDQVNLLTL